MAVILNSGLDWSYYGHLTFPPWNFLKFNLVKSLSVFYGSMPWHYYISQGLPLLLTFYIFFAIQEISSVLKKVGNVIIHNSEIQAQIQAKKAHNTPYFTRLKSFKSMSSSLEIRMQLTLSSLVTILVYSLIRHKEVRFIYPLLPKLIILASSALHNTSHISPKWRKSIIIALLVPNVPIAYYTTQVHQRGVIDVVDWLRRDGNNWRSVGFLMPCHSTPWMTSLQTPESKMWALTCEPPIYLSAEEKVSYLDEADQFYANPVDFLKLNFPAPPRRTANPKQRMREETKYQWPERLVFFEALEKEVLADYLGVWTEEREKNGELDKKTLSSGAGISMYRPCKRFFNSHFHDDGRRKGNVVVYCFEYWWGGEEMTF